MHYTEELANIEVIIWDFDGVIVESNHIREKGFREVLSGFPEQDVIKLLEFHNQNGGLSRYVKFRYFFEKIRKERISGEEVQEYAQHFSTIMLNLMTNPDILITDTKRFIQNNYSKYNFHIASGSDQNELNHLCQALDIAQYFITIEGSPTPKIEIVKNLLDKYQYAKSNTLLIGDAINDWDAARHNGISFKGFNNEALRNEGAVYLDSFDHLVK